MERKIINFNTQWLYSDKNYTDGSLFDLDDGSFERVSIPHANTLLTKHKGPGFQEEIESYRFISWYRKRFVLDEEYNLVESRKNINLISVYDGNAVSGLKFVFVETK